LWVAIIPLAQLDLLTDIAHLLFSNHRRSGTLHCINYGSSAYWNYIYWLPTCVLPGMSSNQFDVVSLTLLLTYLAACKKVIPYVRSLENANSKS